MPRKTTIPLYDGDDFQRLAELRQNAEVAKRKARSEAVSAPMRMGDDDPGEPAYLTEAKADYDSFVDEASERAEMWVLEPIGHEEYRRLLKDHPPRPAPEQPRTSEPGSTDDDSDDDDEAAVHPDDEPWGVNVETFPRALLTFVDPDDDEIRTVVEPKFETQAALRKRLKRLAAGEFDTLWTAAMLLNRQGVNDPKAVRYSPTPRSNET